MPDLDGVGLLQVLDWIDAGHATRAAWEAGDAAERHPSLAAIVRDLPDLDAIGHKLRAALDADGRVRDDASPELKRARRRWLRANGIDCDIWSAGRAASARTPT